MVASWTGTCGLKSGGPDLKTYLKQGAVFVSMAEAARQKIDAE